MTGDFDETTSFRLLGAGKAFVAFVLACALALGFQLSPKVSSRGHGCLTRPAHDARGRRVLAPDLQSP
jgi:hypothetical protein